MYTRDEDVEQCIKAEMKTLYPEEYKKIYGEEDDEKADFDKLDLPALNYNLRVLLAHLNSRHSVCDLVDDKTVTQMSLIRETQVLCKEIHETFIKIYKCP